VGFASSGSADQHDIALLSDEAATGEVVGVSSNKVLGERQLGDGELVTD
jgi:hypothetical protein